MHLLETYALSTGSKIKKPFIIKKFFPIPFEKYITIQNSSGMTGKCYDYFQEVVDFLYEYLEKFDYKIVQIGSKEDKPLNNAFQLHGQTNINQTAFILENSKLHIGNDSFAIHMCSAFNIPLIGLYSVSSPEIAGPFWKNNNQICLTPSNWKPSFNPNENPKRVNEIKIELIINSVNKLLNLDFKDNIETLYVGDKFKHSILETIPDQVLSPESFEKQLLNIRIDFLDRDLEKRDYQSIAQNLNIRECCIVTDRPFIIENMVPFKNNLSMVIYDVTKDIDVNFIEKMNFYGINNSCIFKIDESSEKELNDRKEKLIDLPQIIEEVKYPKIDNNIFNNKNIYFKLNKLFIANNKIYLGRYGYLNNILATNSIQYQKIVDTHLDDYIKNDLEYSFIFKKD